VRVHYGPHEKLGIHDHSKMPTIYVYLSDSDPIRSSHIEEHPFTLLRPRVQQGAFRVSPGRIERHSVENMGDRSSDFLRVEMKTIPLGRIPGSFRGVAPAVLSRSSNRIPVQVLAPQLRFNLSEVPGPHQSLAQPCVAAHRITRKRSHTGPRTPESLERCRRANWKHGRYARLNTSDARA
jgi:hypothetical protein